MTRLRQGATPGAAKQPKPPPKRHPNTMTIVRREKPMTKAEMQAMLKKAVEDTK